MAGKFALLVGNSAFRHNSLTRLSAPPNDVLEFKQILEDSKIAGFDRVELKMDAALVDVRGAIGRLYRDRHPDDFVLFYYSGHGLRDQQGDFYLALTETDPEAPDAGSVDEHFLLRLMNGSASRRQLVILDCCHSGAFIPDGLTARDAHSSSQITSETFDPNGYGRFILAATTAELSAFEEDGRSLYTRYLVEGLKTGAAAPEKNEISVHDLHAFVIRRVVEETGAPMKPQLWVDARTNPEPLLLARNPNPRKPVDSRFVEALWDSDSIKAEWGVIRLSEVMKGPSLRLAAEARRALNARLDARDTLSFDVGLRIQEVLSADEVAGSRESAGSPGTDNQPAIDVPKPVPKPTEGAETVRPIATQQHQAPDRVSPNDLDGPPATEAEQERKRAETKKIEQEKAAEAKRVIEPNIIRQTILKALGFHLLLGFGLFYVDARLKRKWLYIAPPLYAIIDVILGPGFDIKPFASSAFGATTFTVALVLYVLSFLDVGVSCYRRLRADRIA